METNNIYSELQEFLVPKTERKWTQYETKLLIDFYKSNINKLGTFKVKNQRALFELISNEFKKINIVVAPTNYLNRWKVLERNYKKFVDHQNQTGRGRKHFEYEVEMDEVLKKKGMFTLNYYFPPRQFLKRQQRNLDLFLQTK
nr:unnamed protein product [Callosobruchus analis]